MNDNATSLATGMTIQQANAAALTEIDPDRVYITTSEAYATRSCDTDSQHGKGVVYLLAETEQEPAVLCLACAVDATKIWLSSQVCDYVTAAVVK